MGALQGFMMLMQYLACVVRLIACITQSAEIEQLADILDCIADLAYCTVCACMQVNRETLPGNSDESREASNHTPLRCVCGDKLPLRLVCPTHQDLYVVLYTQWPTDPPRAFRSLRLV